MILRFHFLLLLIAAEALAASPGLPALRDEYPKAVFYRYANNFQVREGKEDEAYEQWMSNYGRLMGAELDQRVTVEIPERIPVIRRVKQEHPEQFLIFYETGHITKPESARASEFMAGHWAYHPRVRILQNIPRAEGESELRVEMAFPNAGHGIYRDEDTATAATADTFAFEMGRGDDICLYALKPDGTPDWEHAEQVALTKLDRKRGTITVQRGCYGTTPQALTGAVYAAVHIQVVRHHGWRYNFHPACPRDAQGRRAVDVWVKSYARALLPGGTAEHFDALQLDTMVDDVWAGERGSDLDNDGRADPPSSVYDFGAGVAEAMRNLKAALPAHKLLLPDGCNRGFYHINGWEVEGFPGRHDPEWRAYSEVCNRLELSRHICVEPRFTQVQHKIFNYSLSSTRPDGKPAILSGAALPAHLTRTVLGLTTIFEAAATWYSLPPDDPDGRPGIYDEIRMGTAHRLGWLGKPVGEPVYPAFRPAALIADLLHSTGILAVANGGSTAVKSGVLTASNPEHGKDLVFSARLTSPRPDLSIAARWEGHLRAGLPARIPRLVEVDVRGGRCYDGYLIPADPRATKCGTIAANGLALHAKPGAGLTVDWVQGYHALTIANPTGARNPPFWQAECTVPAGAVLDVRVMGGGPFSVEAAEVGSDGKPGPFSPVIAPFVSVGPTFFRRTRALADVGLEGKRMAFRFLSAKGATWAQVAVARPDVGGSVPVGPVRLSAQGYVCDQAVNQVFHFNQVPVGEPLEVTITVEGGEELRCHWLQAFAAPAAVAREFERGLVLANPSPRPVTMDLSKLVPGATFRRLQSVSTQDTATNNGKPVGGNVTLGTFDGLFLIKE